jgi:hypothetical protein
MKIRLLDTAYSTSGRGVEHVGDKGDIVSTNGGKWSSRQLTLIMGMGKAEIIPEPTQYRIATDKKEFGDSGLYWIEEQLANGSWALIGGTMKFSAGEAWEALQKVGK